MQLEVVSVQKILYFGYNNSLSFKIKAMFSLKLKRLIIKQYVISLYLLLINSKLARLLKICHKPQVKFIVISRSRTGSTLLMRQLEAIPHSFVVGEVLGRSKGFLFWKQFIGMFYGYHWKGVRIVGFKYFYYHPVDNLKLTNNVFEYLKRNKEITIIHLIREDLFAVLLSRIIAKETGQWSKKKKNVKLLPFIVDAQKFKNDIATTLSQISQTHKLFSTRENYCKISYEEIISRGGINKIYNLLGYSHPPVFTLTSKGQQKSADKYEMILNLEQLKNIYEQEYKAFSNCS